MAITMKTLITFVFTIFFIVSSVHCGTTATANTPGNGLSLYPHFKIFLINYPRALRNKKAKARLIIAGNGERSLP